MTKAQETKLKEIIAYFEQLPPDRINQRLSAIDDNGCGCVGAHVAHLTGSGDFFTQGTHFLKELLYHHKPEWERGLCLNNDLQKCGSPFKPFGMRTWQEQPLVVFKRLLDLLEDRAE